MLMMLARHPWYAMRIHFQTADGFLGFLVCYRFFKLSSKFYDDIREVAISCSTKDEKFQFDWMNQSVSFFLVVMTLFAIDSLNGLPTTDSWFNVWLPAFLYNSLTFAREFREKSWLFLSIYHRQHASSEQQCMNLLSFWQFCKKVKRYCHFA